MQNSNATDADLTIAGRLEIKDVERVHAQLLETLAAPRAGTELSIDLSSIEAMDTAGAQLLLAAAREAGRSGLHLKYRGASSEAQRVFALLGLHEVLPGRTAS